MPRYFFDIHDGFEFRDDDGRELADMTDVREEAMKVVSELSALESRQKDDYTIIVKVRNEQGLNALTVRMVCQIDDYPRPRLKAVS